LHMKAQLCWKKKKKMIMRMMRMIVIMARGRTCVSSADKDSTPP
jgi:hypothetical protein